MKIFSGLVQIAVALTGWPLQAATAEPRKNNDTYGSLAVTYSVMPDLNVVVQNAPIPGINIEKTEVMKNGWGMSGAVGRRFGVLRLEGEIGYTHNGRKRYEVHSPPPIAGVVVKDSGDQDSLRLMANGFLEGHFGSFRPYVGIGAGAARIKSKSIAARAPFPQEQPLELWKDTDWRFAYQLIAGAEAKTSDRFGFFAQYRWFDAGTMRGEDPRGERFTHVHRGHNFDVGVRLSFQ